MAKIKEISAHKERKIGLPAYSSVNFGASITVSIDEEISTDEQEKIEKQFIELWKILEKQIERKTAEFEPESDEGENKRWLSGADKKKVAEGK